MNRLFDLSGKVALVTGSSRGIGRAIVEEYARAGAKVVISSRKLEACEKVRDLLSAEGRDAIAMAAHAGSKADLASLVEKTISHYGRLDICVANAAVNPFYGSLTDAPDDAFDKTMATNVKAVWWLAQLRNRISSRAGRVISSSFPRSPPSAARRCSASTASRRRPRRRWCAISRSSGVHSGVCVNAIAPGLVKTDFARTLWENEAARKKREAETPLKRLGEPIDIAGVALFLASRAARFVTGQVLVVDGGRDDRRLGGNEGRRARHRANAGMGPLVGRGRSLA